MKRLIFVLSIIMVLFTVQGAMALEDSQFKDWYKFDVDGALADYYNVKNWTNDGTTNATGIIDDGRSMSASQSLRMSTPPVEINSTMTFGGWVKFNSYSSSSRLLEWDDASNGIEIVFLEGSLPARTQIRMNLDGSTIDNHDNSGGAVKATGQWYHMVWRINGTSASDIGWFLNGTNIAEDAGTTGASGGTNELCLGEECDGTDGADITVDEWFFTNEVLTDAEIADLYNSGSGERPPFSTPPPDVGNTITVDLNNIVTGQSIGTTYLGNVTGSLTFTYFNITNNGFCITYTGNGTGTNCTSTGSGSGTFYNITTTKTINADDTVSATSFQNILRINATQLYTNTTLSVFNVTNNVTTNQTTSSPLTIKALVGDNNIRVDSQGNYSYNVTCTAPTPLMTVECLAYGAYDSIYVIGATNNSVSVNNLNGTLTQNTLGVNLQTSTTTGNISWRVLQGYDWTFTANNSAFSTPSSKTFSSNNIIHYYNFTLLTLNTFNITFYNESSNTQLTNTTVYVEFISDSFASNYSTTNGNLEVTLLTPDAYTIRYWYDPNIRREYYTELTPQSYNSLRLYTIDDFVSSTYLPVLVDQAGAAVGNATIQLLRYYIDINGYRVVEMAKTDTNGQAVMHVVPNIINYKLIATTSGGASITTDPAKITASTNTYTINLLSNPLTSILAEPSISNSLTYNNATKTFSLTWTDTSNIVSGACLFVNYYNKSNTGLEYERCTDGNSGSLIYTVTHNDGRYIANGLMNTSTEFSTIPTKVLEILNTKAFQTFGLVGVFLTLLVFLVFSWMGAGRTESIVLGGVFAIFVMGAFGFFSYAWVSFVGILIVGVIIAYKART